MLASVLVAPVAGSHWESVRAILRRIPGLAMARRKVGSSVPIVKGIPATRAGIVSRVMRAHAGVYSAVDAVILARVSCRWNECRMAREVVGWKWHRDDCDVFEPWIVSYSKKLINPGSRSL